MPTVVRESSAGFEGELRWPVHNPPTKAGDLIIFNEACAAWSCFLLWDLFVFAVLCAIACASRVG